MSYIAVVRAVDDGYFQFVSLDFFPERRFIFEGRDVEVVGQLYCEGRFLVPRNDWMSEVVGRFKSDLVEVIRG